MYSWISNHAKDPKNETFVFSDSDSATHKAEATVENLSVDFLSRFFKKGKTSIFTWT